MSHGMIPRKSGKEVFPESVPEHLERHFIRGVFDGDGITDISRKRSGFIGSENLLQSIIDIIDYSNIKLIKTSKSENIYYFLGGKKFSAYLYEYMYFNSTIWLERKKQRLQLICSKYWNAVCGESRTYGVKWGKRVTER